VFTIQKEFTVMKEKINLFEGGVKDTKKEAELEIKEAKLKAEKIINDAELKAKNTILKKERVERELKEFIRAEQELIKKYEDIG